MPIQPHVGWCTLILRKAFLENNTVFFKWGGILFSSLGTLKIVFLTLILGMVGLAQPARAVGKQPQDYQRLIIFGDSYSDNGNVFRETGRIVPNAERYYQGRFSNGPAWGEYFAEDLGMNPGDPNLFIDMAYGGAKIIRPVREKIKGTKPKYYIVPNLSQQIDLFFKEHGEFKKTDLIVVFIGTNDYLPLFHAHPKLFFQNRADQETEQVKRLLAHGGKNFIVFNARNLSYIPYIQHLSVKRYFPLNYLDNYYRQYLLTSIQNFNQRLEENLKNKPEIFMYNIFNFDTAIFSKITEGGFHYSMQNYNYVLTNDSEPCYKNYKSDYQHINGPVCAHPEAYFYYDRIHTTKAVNYLLAEDVYRQYEKRNYSAGG